MLTETTFVPGPELLDSPRGRRLLELPAGPTCSRHGVPGQCPPASTPIAILGAGLAGVALAAWLVDLGVPADDLALFDPTGRPATRFFQRADSLRLAVLRSPYEHHLSPERRGDCDLLDVGRAAWPALSAMERGEIRKAQSSLRSVVPMDVFEAHVAMVTALHGLDDRVVHAEVSAVRRGRGSFELHHVDGCTRAQRVVWAVGQPSRALPDRWWEDADRARFARWDEPAALEVDAERVGVVGRGLSAANGVLHLLRGGAEVVWARRGPVEFRCADVDARFFRPEGRSAFLRRSSRGRAALQARERRPSVMFEFQRLFERARDDGRLHDLETPAVSFATGGSGLVLRPESGPGVTVDRVVGALGLETTFQPALDPAPPTGLALDERTLELRGIPDAFVVGALAWPAVGPAAGNIDGIRFAVERIAPTVADRHVRG